MIFDRFFLSAVKRVRLRVSPANPVSNRLIYQVIDGMPKRRKKINVS